VLDAPGAPIRTVVVGIVDAVMERPAVESSAPQGPAVEARPGRRR